MEKSAKIIIFGSAILLLSAIILLLLNARELKFSKTGVNEIVNELSKRELRVKYEADIKDVIREINGIFAAETVAPEQVGRLKRKMLDMQVPGEYRDLHIKAVQALDKLLEYSAGGEEAERDAGEEMMRELALRYNWIKDN